MTESRHGQALLSENAFEGSMAVQITVHGESMLMSDREFRDVLLCARDMFPSMFQWPLPEQETGQIGEEIHGYDDGVPIRTVHMPVKPCCGAVYLGEECPCDEFAPQQTWGWMR